MDSDRTLDINAAQLLCSTPRCSVCCLIGAFHKVFRKLKTLFDASGGKTHEHRFPGAGAGAGGSLFT